MAVHRIIQIHMTAVHPAEVNLRHPIRDLREEIQAADPVIRVQAREIPAVAHHQVMAVT